MDNRIEKTESQTAIPLETGSAPLSIAEFLETCAPNNYHVVSDLLLFPDHTGSAYLNTTVIRLHCGNEACEGIRQFGPVSRNIVSDGWDYEFVRYVCKNCGKTVKMFALAIVRDGKNTTGRVSKLGELPPFGPPTPSRVMSLVGEDRELFLKGRRAELHGLGIGAFAYYRRVVEEQKGRIIGEIGKVAERLGAPQEIVQMFAQARVETQFSTAIEMIKTAIPESLLINGHNPLTLLHGPLSEGLHARTDAECLELATSVRVVLTDLAEPISNALKDEAELKGAVTKLLTRKLPQG